jgi:Rad3-related DNA helicase
MSKDFLNKYHKYKIKYENLKNSTSFQQSFINLKGGELRTSNLMNFNGQKHDTLIIDETNNINTYIIDFNSFETCRVEINIEPFLLYKVLRRMKNLKHLKFGKEFNQHLKQSLYGLNLESIHFSYKFNKPLDNSLDSLISLKELNFNGEYKYDKTVLRRLKNKFENLKIIIQNDELENQYLRQSNQQMNLQNDGQYWRHNNGIINGNRRQINLLMNNNIPNNNSNNNSTRVPNNNASSLQDLSNYERN